MQKEDFTKDSYELLQRVICDAINMKSINTGQACEDLIIAARILQTKPLIMESLPDILIENC